MLEDLFKIFLSIILLFMADINKFLLSHRSVIRFFQKYFKLQPKIDKFCPASKNVIPSGNVAAFKLRQEKRLSKTKKGTTDHCGCHIHNWRPTLYQNKRYTIVFFRKRKSFFQYLTNQTRTANSYTKHRTVYDFFFGLSHVPMS